MKVYIASIGRWAGYEECSIKENEEISKEKVKYYPEYALEKNLINLLIIVKEKTGDSQGITYLKEKFRDKIKVIEYENETEIIPLMLDIFSDYSEDEVIIDFTHGRRNFSSAILMVGSFLRSLGYGNIKLKYIEFRGGRNKKEDNEHEIEEKFMIPMDISHYSDILGFLVDMRNAVYDIYPEGLNFIYEEFKKRYRGLDSKERREHLNKVIAALKNILFSIKLGIVTDEVKEELDKVINYSKQAKGVARIFLMLIKKELEELQKALIPNKIWERQRDLGIYMWKKGSYQLGAALLREALITKGLEEKGKDIYNLENREKEEEIFKKGKGFENIGNIRNALEHVFTSKHHWNAMNSEFPKCIQFKKEILDKKLEEFLKGLEDEDTDSDSQI